MVFLSLLALGCAPPQDAPIDSIASPTGSPTTGTTGATGATGATGDTGDTGEPRPPSNRDRLLLGYLAYLQQAPDRTRSNGLRGADLADVCDLWAALDQSAQGTFLTLTARLEGSLLADGTSMLDHVTTAWRIAGGEGASGTDPGSCGGGEHNRLFVSIDPVLHGALVDVHALGEGVVADIPADGWWRDSHDLAGPHDPFTMSDETIDGAPRAQAHFFADPASPEASGPLGRLDLEDLVDPYALELDHDYDCVHNSNPGCTYTFYGPLCLPETPTLGATLYTQKYGSFDPGWSPAGCP